MKKLLYGLVLGAATALVGGSYAMAEDAMAKPDMTHVATMMCRPADTGEKATAMTSANGALVCKPISMPDMMTTKKMLDAMPGGQPIWLKMFQDYHIGANGV